MPLDAGPKKTDRVFLLYLATLVIIGLVFLISASTPYGYSKFQDAYYFFKKQVLYGLLPGVVLFLFLAKVDYRFWRRLVWPIYGFCVALLILVFIPGFGPALGGARSWIDLGWFHFQPSELAKLGLIFLLADMLANHQLEREDWKTGLLPVLAAAAPVLILILCQPDLGTLSILLAIVFAMLYLAHLPKKYLFALGALGLAAFVCLVVVAPYRMNRLTIFLHPELDPQGVGYHVNQAFLAVGSGGWWGLGFGHSRQKYQYLPEVQADSIFAVIAEEMGFVVSTALVILILLFAWRGLRIAKNAPDDFGYLLAGGIMVWFAAQSFVNVGAMVGLMPLTGVPLPLFSHGGTALAVTLASLGIVASVSRERTAK